MLIENVHNWKSKYANIENNDNQQDGILTHIRAIRCQCPEKNRRIIMKSDSNESKRDEMSNEIDEDIKEKEFEISNSSIKVHISHSLILLNLSALNSIKQKLTL